MRSWLLIGLACTFVAGCDFTKTYFPVKKEPVRQVEELQTSVTVIPLTAQNIGNYSAKRQLAGGTTNVPGGNSWNYRVGAGDILDVVVWDHPELTMPSGENRTPEQSGLRVQADGTFFYPFVGQIPAKGLTPEAIRENLKLKLADYIPDPQVEVRVVGYNSQSVSITGEVNTPNRQPLTATQVTLLQAVDAAGGLTEDADPSGVTLRRGGALYNVDLQAFLERGLASNNPTLQSGDVVNVPRITLKEAYLLGQIVKGTTIDLTRENISLTQALTRVGGLKEDQADARGIFVFRDTDAGITVYQLDASNPTAFLLGTRFTLHPQDVIYVTTAPLYRWNRLITSLLPSITTVKAADDL
ncbi:sugar ABC transporter substrate-binding protein [Cereibacter changlensis JA139]|uniref:Sugar ABC transporter substrate-binding protein n=2 Tax=Cereibacter changlensis TaxID=402884 RepID=A0A2T4JNW4_9RHOB|nr:polysaccharide biosynthesis/export family protein [Cereibacter changlensis]PTE19594.1 sugar ABC transporter substrate-binding protein [Cereibacter changlensis JA139]